MITRSSSGDPAAVRTQRQLTGTSLERTRAVVDEVLAKAGRDGERVVSYARLALGGIITVLWPVATWDELKTGEASDIGVVALSLLGTLFSVGMLVRLRKGPIGGAMRFVSILVDAALVLGLLATFVATPPPGYIGLGRISGVGAAYFAVLAAGIRLSKRGALVSVAVFFVGIGALLAVDQSRNGIVDTVANWVVIGSFVGTAGIFAWLIAARTHTLVLEGAAQSLLAERARSALGAYVSEEVAEQALAADAMRMGGVRHEVAILFTDLRAFTTTSEKADPEQIVRELNEYLEAMVEGVHAEGGIVDKFIGDSIMAVFGAPSPRADDAARAVRAAWRMEASLAKLNASRERRGLAPLRHGIGVHCGPVVAGNVGTTTRANYTVIGDTVNVAARLESCTKDVGVSVLLSSTVVNAVQGASGIPPLRDVGEVKAKGREEKIAVHTFA